MHLFDVADIDVGTAAGRRCFAHEIAVGCGTYSDREQPRAAKARPDIAEQPSFVGYRPIGDEHYLAQTRVVVYVHAAMQCPL